MRGLGPALHIVQYMYNPPSHPALRIVHVLPSFKVHTLLVIHPLLPSTPSSNHMSPRIFSTCEAPFLHASVFNLTNRYPPLFPLSIAIATTGIYPDNPMYWSIWQLAEQLSGSKQPKQQTRTVRCQYPSAPSPALRVHSSIPLFWHSQKVQNRKSIDQLGDGMVDY